MNNFEIIIFLIYSKKLYIINIFYIYKNFIIKIFIHLNKITNKISKYFIKKIKYQFFFNLVNLYYNHFFFKYLFIIIKIKNIFI